MERIYLNKSPDFLDNQDEYLGKFIKFIFSNDSAYEVARDFCTDKYTIRSPYSDGTASVVAGGYTESSKDGVFGNFLLLQDEITGKRFAIMQRMRFASCVILPDHNVIISPSPSDDDDRALRISMGLLNNISDAPYGSCSFGGIIFGSHGRPYHQIYDQLPLFCEFSKITRGKLLVHRPRSFFSPEDFGFDAGEWHPPKGEAEWGEKFYLLASRIFSIKKKYPLLEAVDLIRARNSRLQFADEMAGFREWRRSHHPIVWLGVCDLKPRWTSSIEAIKLTISKLKNAFPRIGFVFDGMTAPAAANNHKFRQKHCAGEYEKLNDIVDEMSLETSHFSVMGSPASTKIHIAAYCDYFVSNAGTDAVWPALFHRKPGLTHCANKGRSTVNRSYIHPKSILIPEDRVQDIEQGKVWHWADYRIDPIYFSDIVLSGLRNAVETGENTKLISLGECGRDLARYAILNGQEVLERELEAGKYISRLDIYSKSDLSCDFSAHIKGEDHEIPCTRDKNGEFLFEVKRDSRVHFDIRVRSGFDFEFHGLSLCKIEDGA
ncbi:hypothetical protein [Sphingobium baderi]|uniref:hypothetical protein n=2 Tax=Sphingobium baderi TaxID=1332080 RepID=UPI0004225BFD|nr:hypothetical protein [Sphingobium baderi]